MKVPLTRPDLGEAEVEAAARVVRSGWVMQGREVAALEAEMAAVVGAAHAVAVSSGTAALELALRAVDIGPGDDVATVSHSFIATANAVLAVGARPIFVDVDERTMGMDAAALERALTTRTRAVLCVHQLGVPCDLVGILAVAARHGLPVIEDAACALGSEREQDGTFERIGRPRGRLACFSFHPRKIVTTGDGGMVTTADAALARRVRRLRQHGVDATALERAGASDVVFEPYVEPAFNFRMTDLQAAIGRPQLVRLGEAIAERRRLADVYREALRENAALAPPEEPEGARSNWQSFPVRLREPARFPQRAAIAWLRGRGIAAGRGVANAHQEPAYAGHRRFACGPEPCAGAAKGHCERLPISERLRDETVLLPLFHGMTAEEQDAVIAATTELGNLGSL